MSMQYHMLECTLTATSLINTSVLHCVLYLPNISAKAGPTIAPISPPIAVIETAVDQTKSVIVTL